MRRAPTLTETLILAVVIGLGLLAIALGIDTVRQDLKRRQAERVLATLDRALVAYHHAAGRWPTDSPGEAQRGASSDEGDGSGDRVVAALAGVPESRHVLEGIPPAFLVAVPVDGPAPASRPWGMVQDAWGQPLRCLTAGSSSPADQEAVAANGGKPIFISAGPDECFGFHDVPAAADNIRSDGR